MFIFAAYSLHRGASDDRLGDDSESVTAGDSEGGAVGGSDGGAGGSWSSGRSCVWEGLVIPRAPD